MQSIIIVGGGFSGFFTAIRLINNNPSIKVTIVNSGFPIGNGPAYMVEKDNLILNVPAGNMSAFEDEPDHFIQWLIKRPPYAQMDIQELKARFVPRKIYGDYLNELAVPYMKHPQLTIVEDRAVELKKDASGYEVITAGKKTIKGASVLLATGNVQPAHPAIENKAFFKESTYFQNPWNGDYTVGAEKLKEILIIGTGLTMVDCVINLFDAGFTGKITALSPRGYTPSFHTTTAKHPDFYTELKGRSLQENFQTVRHQFKLAEQQGVKWQAVIDAIRPHIQEIWSNYSLKDKKQFINHVRHIWGVSRHRLNLEQHTQLMEHIQKQNLTIKAGRLINIEQQGTDILCTYRKRGSQEIAKFRTQRVINCTGPQSNYKQLEEAFYKKALDQGLIFSNELNLGLKTDIHGRLLNDRNEVIPNLFAIGSLLRGTLWETTAVPDLRKQTANISDLLVERPQTIVS